MAFARPILCLVVDRSLAGAEPCERIAQAVRAGVDWVQIRDRELSGAALLAHALAVTRAARAAGAKHPVRVIVNRRLDVALCCGADGVHLGYDGVDPETARGLLPPDSLVGISCHGPEEVTRASRAVSYAQLAPIFPPLSKPGSRSPLGIGALAEAARGGLPVLAQGGIEASNAARARAAGAAGAAVTGAILQAADPAQAAAELRAALDSVPWP